MIQKAAQVIKRAFQMGWDQEFGGLLLFADQDGGPPRGSLAGIENERMAQKVLADWGSKLWWVHSEALYTTLLAWRLTGDDEFLALYRQVFDYTFRTFPNPDRGDRRVDPDSRSPGPAGAARGRAAGQGSVPHHPQCRADYRVLPSDRSSLTQNAKPRPVS